MTSSMPPLFSSGRPTTDLRKDKTQISDTVLGQPPEDSLTVKSSHDTASNAGKPDEWTHSTREILNTLPRVWSRSVLYAMAVFAVVVVPWAMVFKVDEVSTATGKLEPKGQTIHLDAPMMGTIEVVHVQEGQSVTKGQPLIEFETDRITAELEQAEQQLEGLKNRLTQLELGKSQIAVSIRLQEQQYQAQIGEQQAQFRQAQQQLAFDQAAIDSSDALLVKDHDQVSRLRRLESEGVVSSLQREDAERTLIENQRQLEQGRTELAKTRTEIEKQQSAYNRVLKEGKLAATESRQQLQALDAQIADARTQVSQTETLIASLRYQHQQHIVTAPVNGTVFQLPQKNPGAVVPASQNLAQLAPQDAPLVLRTTMESRQTGFLSVGLPAKVKFDAYPFQQYGIVPGRVTYISPDSQLQQLPDGRQQQVYLVDIALDKDFIAQGTEQITFSPGQAATAEVIVRQRRLIDFILDPFKQLKADGMSL